MRQIIFIALLITFSVPSFSQGCWLVSGTVDKKTRIETKGGVVSSKDYYSLLIHKRFDPNDTLNYMFFLNAASKVMLSDSLLHSKGKFELFLVNGQIITLHNAECMNNPMGFGSSIGFKVNTNEEIIKKINNNPIIKIKVFGILETKFSPNKQKQQQKILTCLINDKYITAGNR